MAQKHTKDEFFSYNVCSAATNAYCAVQLSSFLTTNNHEKRSVEQIYSDSETMFSCFSFLSTVQYI